MNKSNPEVLIRGKRVGFCYLICQNGHQKIGQSLNVDGVIATARRFDASARLLTCWPGPDYAEAETIMHAGLKKWRIENEQFQMPAEVTQWIAQLDDLEFSTWVWETDCDERAIGWKFPRIYLSGKTRMWPSLFVPESDLIAWAMVASDTKPEYSLVEKLWSQNAAGFNSVWLGRTQRL